MRQNEKPHRSLWTTSLRLALGIVVVILLLVFVPKVNFVEIKNSLLNARLAPLGIGVLGVFAMWSVRAVLLHRILTLKTKIGLGYVWMVTMAGAFFDLIVPARGGYFLRWGLLSARMSGAKGFVFSALVAAVAIEGGALLGLFAFATGFSQGIDQIPPRLAQIAFAVFIVICIVGIIFSGLFEKLCRKTFLIRITPLTALFEIANAVKSPSKLFGWLLLAVSVWMIQAFAALAFAAALNIPMTFSESVILLFAMHMAILIPLIPGNLGTVQLVISWVLIQFGVPKNDAIAFSLVYHAGLILPVLFLGSLTSLFLPLKKIQS